MKELRLVIVHVAFVLLLFVAGTTRGSVQANGESKDAEAETRSLIGELRQGRWLGIELLSESPTNWGVHLTEPMRRILQIGPPAQFILLGELSDPSIKDQVMFLLGGLGDERSVGPIIEAMVDADQMETTANAVQINMSASFALTNITTADVVWPYSGGNIIENCSAHERKASWERWWKKHRTFTVKSISARDRDYPHYPSYGIYKVSNTTGFWKDPEMN